MTFPAILKSRKEEEDYYKFLRSMAEQGATFPFLPPPITIGPEFAPDWDGVPVAPATRKVDWRRPRRIDYVGE